MCNRAVYRDPLPDIALAALKSNGIPVAFVSRDSSGPAAPFRIEIRDWKDRVAAFHILSALFPDDADWKRVHVSAAHHGRCLNCGVA